MATSLPTISLSHLDELWFQVSGTLCNLTCNHCFISCSPTNKNFGFLSLATIQASLEQSVKLGVKGYYFTGGEHSLDFYMADGSDNISAVGPGKVMAVKEDSNITCSSNCNDANYVLVDHGSNFYASYFHFCQNCVAVNVGENITTGNYNLGYAGNTGWSTAPHLHFEIRDFEESCTVKYNLEGASGELTVDQTYTSTNNAADNWSDSNISNYTGNVFSKAGITLTSNIPWYNKTGDTITITGSITDGKSDIMVFLLPETGGSTQVSNSKKTVTASNSTLLLSEENNLNGGGPQGALWGILEYLSLSNMSHHLHIHYHVTIYHPNDLLFHFLE